MTRRKTHVFLDANILFSAAYREDAPLGRLWELDGVVIVTSPYALAEAMRNLADDVQRDRLDTLMTRTELSDYAPPPELPPDVRLPPKDRPILQAAITAGAAYLLTGDRTHFGAYYDTTVRGVTILTPAKFLATVAASAKKSKT